MNDADLNDNIGEHSQPVDGSHREKTGQDVFHTEQMQFDPTRWWFASSAFPMVAGTLGPVASAFSICALVKNWRQHIEPGSDITKALFVPDPPWLYAVNAVQLVIALVANVFLLLNMTKRVRFSIAQPITIVGWYISSVLLVGLCATAGGPLVLGPVTEYVWSQAFYYGIFAAVLYFIVASLMVVTVWGAQKGHYAKDFKLTTSQRTLMLQTIVFLMYLLVGALVFSNIEGWSYLDAVYWADVTLFTVGFGEISPSTDLGRGLLLPYALVGVISFGLVIGSIRSLILDRGKRRLDARMLEKKREQLVRHLTHDDKLGVLEPIDTDTPNGSSEDKGHQRPQTEFERRQREFQLMRKIQHQSDRRRRWTAMGISTTTWAILWLVGARIFQICEEPYQAWTYFDGVYFSFEALTTVGYGDYTPVSNAGKAFFVFWSLLALPTQTVLISNAGDTIVKSIRDGVLRIGNLTILPGEHSFKSEVKQVLSRFGLKSEDGDEDRNVEVLPAGFLGAAQPHNDLEEAEDGDEADSTERDRSGEHVSNDGRQPNSDLEKGNNQPRKKESSPPKRGRVSSDHPETPTSGVFTVPRRGNPPARKDLPTRLPKTRAEYHLVLIDEIMRVTRHLQHSPPRKYNFKEWAWYLRLIGEDESSTETHRKPHKRSQGQDTHARTRILMGTDHHHHHHYRRHHDQSSPNDEHAQSTDRASAEQGQEKLKWSWLGHRSPLMDTREEAEWILDKLEQRLREELQAVVKAQEGNAGLTEVDAEEDENEQKDGVQAAPF